jgi:uncharacterized protein YbjT (DUF2867 family)
VTIVLAGAAGNTGRRMLERLRGARVPVRGLVRREAQLADVEALGAEPVLCDLERDDPSDHVRGAEAIVFAAGAGAGSGPERKETMDLGGAVKLIEAAEAHGVRRYVLLSSMGAGDPEAGPEAMRPYLRAKARADERLRASGLAWTIARPGRLTDDPGTGTVEAAGSLGRRGEITRDDVAHVLVACLGIEETVGRTFEVLAGDTPVEDALRAL